VPLPAYVEFVCHNCGAEGDADEGLDIDGRCLECGAYDAAEETPYY